MSRQITPVIASGAPFRVGEWLVEPTLNRLVRAGTSIQLELKAMDVLLCLVEHSGEVVTKNDLLDAVWETEFVSDNTLYSRIAELRDAFGDNALEPRYIETIRKRGYRLIAEVRTASDAAEPDEPLPAPSSTGEERSPYPGLAPFTEADADHFFGREIEITELWRRISSRRLLAVIGPSGIGKSSLLRAGVASRAPPGWRVVVFTAGEAPVLSLARALAPDHAGDSKAVTRLIGFTDPDTALAVVSRWRDRFEEAVLVVDQFEELFTLNAPEVQAGFIELLRRLVDAADVHIVLAMRDDFLHHCQRFPRIAPIFKDLTPLGPPTGAALRRAIEEPAARHLYRFSSELLVNRMISEVEDQRGALPLLAFAVHRLWEERDREQRTLTEAAYDAMGGVAGALAGHAEATLDRIGPEGVPVVRELFRNLITAEGTRAVREVDELLTVFRAEDRGEAAEVLRHLIDARLLTAFTTPDREEEPERRVEIIHESLFEAWPRLVRWQTQDADAAQLRDQLRRAARTWHERGRGDDLLWTGAAYREFVVWHESYPGGLTAIETDFAEAMISLATRNRRLRRIAGIAGFIALLVVLGIVAGSRQQAVKEARRAEAASLFSLAQLHSTGQISYALAYSIASLEHADSAEARRLALQALWRGPTVLVLPTESPSSIDFGPNGHWLATAGSEAGGLLWPSDGGPPTHLDGSDLAMEVEISPRGDLVAATTDKERRQIGLWSFPEGRFLRSFEFGDDSQTMVFQFSQDGRRLFTSTQTDRWEQGSVELEIRSWPVEGGESQTLVRLDLPASISSSGYNFNPNESLLALPEGHRVLLARLEGSTVDLAGATSVEHEAVIGFHAFDSQGQQLATSDTSGWVRIWSLEHDPPVLTHSFRGGAGSKAAASIAFDPTGTLVLCGGGFLWDLSAPPEAEPLRLRAPASGWGGTFSPDGHWLGFGGWTKTILWPLSHTYPRVLRGHEAMMYDLVFTPDGEHLISASDDGSLRMWSVGDSSREPSRVLEQTEGVWAAPDKVAMASDGSFVLTGSRQGRVAVVPLDGGPVCELGGFSNSIGAIAVGPRARLVAAGGGAYDSRETIVRVWDLVSGEIQVLDPGDTLAIRRLDFTAAGDLWVGSGTMNQPKLRRWSLGGKLPRILEELDLSSPGFAGADLRDFDPKTRQALLRDGDRLWIQDLDTLAAQELSSHPDSRRCRLDTSAGIVLTSDGQDGIRVGRTSGEEPHLLLGHEGQVRVVALSPDGRWIASGGADATVRLWRMPDLSKTPLHALPRDELLAKLRALTNLRAVEDPASPSGWKIEPGPFPGWETAPSW